MSCFYIASKVYESGKVGLAVKTSLYEEAGMCQNKLLLCVTSDNAYPALLV